MATGREVAGGDEADHASADNNCIVNVWHYVFGTRWLVVQVLFVLTIGKVFGWKDWILYRQSVP